MAVFCSRFVPIPDRLKRSPRLLFSAIGRVIFTYFLRARATRLLLLVLAVGTLARLFTGSWDWGGSDAYCIALLSFGLIVWSLAVHFLEESFHAIVPVAKGRPDWLRGMIVGSIAARGRRTTLVFLFVAIKHEGDWSPLDSFHISAAGPLGVLAVAGILGLATLAYYLLGGINLVIPALVILPLVVNGLVSLIPMSARLNSDGSSMLRVARKMSWGPRQYVREALRSVAIVGAYLWRHALPSVWLSPVLLLELAVAWAVLTSTV